MKVVAKTGKEDKKRYYCPKCDNLLNKKLKAENCPKCGEKLEWPKVVEVYKLIDLKETTFEKLKELNYCMEPPYIYKVFKVPYENDTAQSVVTLFNNISWQKKILTRQNKSEFRKFGIKFKNKKVVENDNFKDLATHWTLVIDVSDDSYLGISIGDESYPWTFYKKSILDENCPEILTELKALGMLEVVKVED